MTGGGQVEHAKCVEDFVASVSDKQAATQRVEELVATFEQRFGKKPAFVARNPGRVNLIGEHIDYMGFSVLPMAIEMDAAVAIAPTNNEDHHLHVHHANAVQYPAHRTEFGHAISINTNAHSWSHYVLAGVKGVLEHMNAHGLSLRGVTGAHVLVHGTVPMGAGLSSSSALVCASALATASLLGLDLPKADLAELCRGCEQYVGTAGGGMDQAISFLATQGVAQRIHFHPLKASPVPLPAGGVFVVSNSLAQSLKAETAHTQFNKRVVECRLACALLASALGLDASQMEQFRATEPKHTIRQLVELSGLTLPQFEAVVDKALQATPYTAEEIAAGLGMQVAELQSRFLEVGGRVIEGPFKLQSRAKHVVSEARRVEEFEECCHNNALSDEDRLKALGDLMNSSHESCSGLYECSSENLDRLAQICREHGALGSRLTGAGWGGCVVSLVPARQAQQFLDAVWQGYFADLPEAAGAQRSRIHFATPAGAGGLVWDV